MRLTLDELLDSFRMASGQHKTKTSLEAQNFWPHTLTSMEWKRERQLGQSPMANELINNAYIMELPKNL